VSRRTVLFDLDGTISDSAPGILGSIEYAFIEMGLPYPGHTNRALGPPIKDIFAMLGCPPDRVEEAISHYRVRYRHKGLFENTVYDGIPDLLERLIDSGAQLAIATSKPELFAERILEHFGLAKRFAFIGGATMDSSRAVKADVIAHTLAHLDEVDLATTVMVGDRLHDIHGATAHNLPAYGVLWGYGSLAELTEAGAYATVANPSDLADLLLP
jgi:phosphoglycolate phosphatase